MGISKLFRKLIGESKGWEKAAKVNCTVLIIASLILVSLSIAVVVKKKLDIIFILSSDCDGSMVSVANLAFHLLINICSTLVLTRADRLASSNFFMQILNAPSREEINNAHFKGSWLGIGVPSVRNIFLLSKFKAWCWVALFISSIPIHLLFNSTIFETNYRSDTYSVTIATEEFVRNGAYFPPGASLLLSGQHYMENGIRVDGEDFDNPQSAILQNILKAAKNASSWERVDSKECWEKYVNCGDLTKYLDVVIVVDKPLGWIRNDMWQLSTNQSLFWDRYIPADEPNHLFFHGSCSLEDERGTAPSSLGWWNVSDTLVEEPSEYNQRPPGLQPNAFLLSMDYCLAETAQRICHISLSPTLLLAVTATVVTKSFIAVVITVTLSKQNQPPLVTLGDAVASFIEKPDPTTMGFCTFDQNDMKKALGSNTMVLPGPRCWHARHKRRLAVIPWSTWLSSYLLFIVGISLATYYFTPAVKSTDLRNSSTFLPTPGNPATIIDGMITFTQAILLVNSPQLLLSFFYLAYNNLFTRIQMAKEWGLLASTYRPLRVTHPQGTEQFATYRLQLPYKYSLPLIAISISLHWLLSNTIYIYVSLGGYYSTYGQRIVEPSLPQDASIEINHSALALLSLIIASVVLIFVPILLGLKRLPKNSINSGCNSFAISAACHSSVLAFNSGNGRESFEYFNESTPPQSEMLSAPLLPPSQNNAEWEKGSGVPTNDQAVTDERRIWVDSEASESDILTDSYTAEQTPGGFVSEHRKRSLKKLAQSKIRWGVIRMPPEWYIEYAGDVPVEHLGFGAEEDMVSSPVSGNLYA
ncbi:hypothetical protein GGR51DRAFT_568865 [Nemania sp. FL0031]|nr:hypothetical protein GGR51DRAFT_568865 [Nemania sp. FL0031]